MKIAMVYDFLYPYNVGGVEVRNYKIARELAMRGHEVHLFGVKLWSGEDTFEREGVYYHGVENKRQYHFKSRRRILETIRYSINLYRELRKHEFDVIDCTSLPYFTCLACRLAHGNAKFVITWHQYFGDYLYEYLGPVKGFLGVMLEKLTKRLTKNHVSVSGKTKKDLGLENVQVIRNGLDLDVIDRAKPVREGFDLIFVGRLIAGKNVGLLVRSLLLLGEKPRTVVVGDGPDMEELVKLTEELGLGENVTFAGVLGENEVYSYLKSSKVFVSPSVLEGFGMAVLEAMACGLPAVVVRHKWNASSELVEDGVTGMVVENSESGLAGAIRMLLEDGEKRASMSEKAKEYARGFSWSSESERLVEYYNRILCE